MSGGRRKDSYLIRLPGSSDARPNRILYYHHMWVHDPADDLYHAASDRLVFGHTLHPRTVDWFRLRTGVTYFYDAPTPPEPA